MKILFFQINKYNIELGALVHVAMTKHFALNHDKSLQIYFF